MTPSDIHGTYKQILLHLSQNKLKDAFEKTEKLATELQSAGHKESLQHMQTNYRYMLRYFMDGSVDPERKSVYNKLVAKMFALAGTLRDELLTRDSSNFEFSQKRYFPHTPQIAPEKLREALDRGQRLAELQEAAPDNGEAARQVEVDFEQAVSFLFSYFWLTSAYDSSAMMAIYDHVMSAAYTDSTAKSMLMSALTLNLWRTFDEQKTLMLIDACKSDDLFAQQRALVGLCFVLTKYNRFLPYFPAIRNRLMLLADEPSVVESLQHIIIQIIATTETPQVSKKLQEEILPELVKLRSLADKDMAIDSLLNGEEWGEANPEWEEMLRESVVSDKFQELAEMEMSGADVYMSTFSMLKSFPFFSHFPNWFLPFDLAHSSIGELFRDHKKSLVTVLSTSNAMCNSDKYSFCLSIAQMPHAQRDVLKNALGDAVEQMDEMQKEEALYSPQSQRKAIARHYIQDLFRFFRLHPQHADFTDLFSTSLIMHKTYLFELLAADNDLKSDIAEYYFSKKLYPQALELFEHISREGEPTAVLYQKIGYAYQQTSQLALALNAYKKADLIHPDDFWTNRKMALCHQLMGDTDHALKAYRHAHFIRPENLSVQLRIADCLIELKRYDEALNTLSGLHRTHPNNLNVLRTMIHASLSAKNLPQAAYFTSLLFEDNHLNAQDYIVAGHTALLTGKTQEAKAHYDRAFLLCDNDRDRLTALFEQEKNLLLVNDVSEQDIALILDAIKYNTTVEG